MVIPVDKVAAAMLHLALLGLVFGSISLAIGAVSGSAGLSRGVPAAVAVVAYLVNGLGPMVSWLDPVHHRPVLPVHRARPAAERRLGARRRVAVATVVVLIAVAVWGFRRRDVHG